MHNAKLIKCPSVLHLKGLRVQLAINTVMVSILGDKQLGIVRKRDICAVVIERSRIAMGDGEIRIFLNLNPLLPLPDERRVDLPLLLQRQPFPKPFTRLPPVQELFRWSQKLPDYFKRRLHNSKSS